ncbi:hypothetical protein BH09BAC6_BH09BAC6_32840 [soil metagenome]
MEIELSPRALIDLEKWKRSGNYKVQQKITDLINSILQTPFTGIGKPEPLKHELKGLWSRRITQADRYVMKFRSSLLSFTP